MGSLLLLLFVTAIVMRFFARKAREKHSRLDSLRQASTDVNRAVLRGRSSEARKTMERVAKEAELRCGAPMSGSIHIGPRGGRYRINSKGRKSYDV